MAATATTERYPTVPTTIPGLLGGVCLILFVLPIYWPVAAFGYLAFAVASNPLTFTVSLLANLLV